MEKSPRRGRRVWLFVLICVLHGVLIWFLLAKSRVIWLHAQARRFEVLPITPARILLPPARDKPRPAAPRSVFRPARRRIVIPEKDAESNAQTNAINPPPIDWNAELARAGRAATGLDSKSPVKEFGFLTRSPTMAEYPQFDWDYARTHRVESLPEGGVIIHLNDHCALVMTPFPFPFCSPFKRKANGELFKHMHDPVKPGDPLIP